MADKVTINLTGLDAIAKAFKGKLPIIRVGILGNDARSMQVQGKDGNFTTQVSSNATIGAAHEFGTSTMPQRSFLRMPLQTKLDKAIEKSDMKKTEYLNEVIKTKSIRVFMGKIAVLAKAVIKEAFLTGGFGKWAKWKNPKYTNNTGQILVNTQQLRDSISSEVK